MDTTPTFTHFFEALWEFEPFPWQRMLAERLAEGEWPKVLDLPTAAGKTACIDIALYALAAQADKPVWERTAPRRVWFVVDRRIVVDEAFERAREIAEKLCEARGGALKMVADRLREVSGTERPLAVGRLRGGVLRDDGWARLPSQPAVITSTVDQLGSRILFRGYGGSALSAPIYAGLAAHDSLILLDEAHLSVPFMQTLRSVERYRGEDWAEQSIRTPFAFAMLSATQPADIPEDGVFPGVDREAALDHPELDRRVRAAKPAELVLVKASKSADKDPLVETAAERATAFVKGDERQRVAVIVNRVRTAEHVAKLLHEQRGDEMDVVLLTGRLRPFERDRLVARWKPFLKANRPEAPERPIVLVSTQCIEVGADFSFDALVSEIASLDALRQRFGRLNRLGRSASAPAVILARDEDVKAGTEDFVYGVALAQTWHLLHDLAETQTHGKQERSVIDFGIATLDSRLQEIDVPTPYLAPAPAAPLLLPSHVDLLCQTAPRPRVEPDIQLYLHGTGRGRAEVRVAWRADLDAGDTSTWAETVALCPPNSAEAVVVPLYRLRQWLAEGAGEDDAGDVEGAPEAESQARERIRPALVWRGRERSRVCDRAAQLTPDELIVLPAAYGMEGLGQSAPEQTLGAEQLDIWEPSHARSGKPVALRLHRAVLKSWLNYPPLQMLAALAGDPAWERESVRDAIDAVLAYKPEGEDDPPAPPEWWLTLLEQARDGHCEQHPGGGLVLRARKAETQALGEQDLFADDDDLLSAVGQEVRLDIHSASVERAVDQLASRCLPEAFRAPLKTAAYWHDVGKLDERFQIMLRQGDELAVLAGEPLAKSAAIPESPARRRAVRAASGLPENFRHEMLSLQLAERCLPNGSDMWEDDLLLHAVASHHGHGRPFAPISPDPAPPSVQGMHGRIAIVASAKARGEWPAPHALTSGVPERFWRLTRRFGWWGLAYLEAILRLGDWYGSRWMVDRVPAENEPLPQSRSSDIGSTNDKSLVLGGIDGANPLGFLAALGALVVLHEAGGREVCLAWQRDPLIWRPRLSGLPTDDPKALSELLARQLAGRSVFKDAERKRKDAEQRFSMKKKEIKDRRDSIKKSGLRGKERKQTLDEEVAPLELELEVLRRKWLEALRQSVPSSELALGKNIDCTEQEYRAIAEPLLQDAHTDDRQSLDLLAAFCSAGCLHESPSKRKDGKLAVTPFAFITGSGHQDFLDTAGALLQNITPDRLTSVLFTPWIYEDEGLSMRWDPVEDRRYALMDRDPTASDNKPRTVWMANLLAYRALALFPSVPQRYGLRVAGWFRQGGNDLFAWPLWTQAAGLDVIRSLLLSPELFADAPDQLALRARGIEAIFRARRIKVGTGANFKVNFSPARRV